MKSLKEITLRDARHIIESGYPSFFRRDQKWYIIPEKINNINIGYRYKCDNIVYEFIFTDNYILIEKNSEKKISDSFLNPNYKCYLRALKLGYKLI